MYKVTGMLRYIFCDILIWFDFIISIIFIIIIIILWYNFHLQTPRVG